MPFMVIYRTADGSSRFEQSDAIDEAALFVERLRNSEGIDQVRIYRMEEIDFAFRPYYKVELGAPDRATVERTSGRRSPVTDDQAVVPSDEAPTSATDPPDGTERNADVVSLPQPSEATDDLGAAARRGLFGR